MTQNRLSTELVGDRELVLRRTFDVPRELVWKAGTEPERIPLCSGPREGAASRP